MQFIVEKGIELEKLLKLKTDLLLVFDNKKQEIDNLDMHNKHHIFLMMKMG